MKYLVCGLALLAIPAVAFASDSPPDWAYPVTPPSVKIPPPTDEVVHVAGTTATYTEKDVANGFAPPDWFPNEHPPMPQLVAHGKPPNVHACSQCHLATGYGHPESANLTGLAPGYIEEQIREFRNGDRRSSVARRSSNMVEFAKYLTDDDVKAAAEYFASVKPVIWTNVRETDMVPDTFVGEGNMRFAAQGNAMEPIGHRIIEIPENEAGAKVRDPHASFIAYVPKGAIEAGQKLATTGGDGKTFQCSICHGADYKGVGNVPSLAGHGAIYIFRQLYDIQHGTRKGPAVALMEPVVKNLTQDDMIDLAAFMASRDPRRAN
jgi:cytochrome c553